MSMNTICWTDIPVTDLDRAIAFYSAVLSEPVTRQRGGPDFEFGLLPHKDTASGCLAVCEDNKPSQTGPLIYLSVEGRLDDAAEVAKSRGGKVLQERHQIGPYGFRVLILDSEGNRIALHSSK